MLDVMFDVKLLLVEVKYASSFFCQFFGRAFEIEKLNEELCNIFIDTFIGLEGGVVCSTETFAVEMYTMASWIFFSRT